MTRYHLTLKNQIDHYGESTVVSGTKLSDGNYRALIDWTGDCTWLEECLEADENVVSYTTSVPPQTKAARALRAIPSERVAKFICRSCGDTIPESEVELDAVEDMYVHAAEGDYKDGMWHRVMCGPIVRIEEVPCE